MTLLLYSASDHADGIKSLRIAANLHRRFFVVNPQAQWGMGTI
jgi:hypothetical protein